MEPNVINPLYVAPVAELLVSAPDPVPEPFIVNGSSVANVNPFKSSFAPELTVVAPPFVPKGPLGNVPATPSLSVPDKILVAPE